MIRAAHRGPTDGTLVAIGFARRPLTQAAGSKTESKEISVMRTPSLVLLTALVLPAACVEPPGAPAAAAETAIRQAEDDDGPGQFESVEYMGDACEGTAETSFSPDRQVFTSIFSDFVAAVGPDTPPEQASRGCLLLARVNVPEGWSYTLESVDYRGFAGLEGGVTATRDAMYLISGNPVHTTPTATFRGPISDDYNDADVGPDAPIDFSRCGEGQDLWIAVQTGADNQRRPRRNGQLTVDSLDVELKWRRCE
jgi:hypothetical protein